MKSASDVLEKVELLGWGSGGVITPQSDLCLVDFLKKQSKSALRFLIRRVKTLRDARQITLIHRGQCIDFGTVHEIVDSDALS